MKSTRLILGLLLMVTSACASTHVVPQRELDLEIPDAWSSDARAGEPMDLWWKDFGDEKVLSLLDEALLYNRNLKAASARVDAAAAQARIAGADLLPAVNAGFNASRSKQVFVGLPIPGTGGVFSTTNNNYGVSLNVSWEADLWGRLRAGKKAALADYQAAQADLEAARHSLIAQTLKAWFTAAEARRQVELALATVENFRDSSARVKARYERGLRSPLDLRLSLSTLAGSEAVFHRQRDIEEKLVRQLELLLGRYPSAELETPGVLPEISGPVPAGIPANVLSRRPDLQAAQSRLAAADARYDQAKASLYPRLSLTGSTGTASNELGDLLDGDFSVWSLVGNLLQPVFQGGRLRAGVDLSSAGSDLALAQYADAVLHAFAEVESALAAEKHLAELQAALERAVREATAARTLAETRYSAGLEDFITVLNAQRDVYTAQSSLLGVQRERLETRIDLHLALGGSFEVRADTGAEFSEAQADESVGRES